MNKFDISTLLFALLIAVMTMIVSFDANAFEIPEVEALLNQEKSYTMTRVIKDDTYHVHEVKVVAGYFQGDTIYNITHIICKEKH